MVLVALMKNVRHYRLTADQYEYFGTWYASVIRELLCMRNFGNNFSHLAQALIPPIKPTEARRAVRLLERLKLVTKRNDGLYEQSHAAIRSTVGLAPQCIRNLNRQMLEFALQAIETFSKKERNISGMTLGLSPATYDLLVAEIDAFKDRIESIVNRNDTANRVFQLNVQLFPLSREVDCDTNKKDGAQ